MKRDILVALIAIAAIVLFCFALSTVRAPLEPTPSKPFSLGAAGPVGENVIMRVNGEPVTEREFAIFTSSLPQQAQMYLDNPQARRLLAEQYVRMKVLEQEGRRLGSDQDPDVDAKMRFGKTNVADEYAMRKLGEHPDEKALRDEYAKSKGTFDVIDLNHILIGYRGSQIPSRRSPAPSRQEAIAIANDIAAKLKAGEPFEKLAGYLSDDQASAQVGGRLGAVQLTQLPPDLQGPIAHLKAGEISAPVMSQFGVHIFRVNSRQPQNFEQVKPLLQQRTRDTLLRDTVEKLFKQAKIEYDPKFFPPQPKVKMPPS